jgi:hypothetical protein
LVKRYVKKKLLDQKKDRPKRYWFSVNIIALAIKNKLKTSTSFRALSLSFGIYISSLKLSCNPPTHTTLLNWIHKIGYYELTMKKEIADDWVVILDESIQLGQDKVLVVYGIRASNIDYSRPLKFQDLVPLRVISKNRWNGELIKDVILKLEEEIGPLKYAVGDYGCDIKKGLELCNIPHVHDLTHKIALFLEKRFKNHLEYKELIDKMSNMRVKYSQTKIAHIIPPKQRKKSRYQNIKIISDWCVKSLKYLDVHKDKDIDIYDNLKWLKNYSTLITELSELNTTINNIEKKLKHNGFDNKIKLECIKELDQLKSDMGIDFKNYLVEYFKDVEKLVPKTDKILITSDIIESAFGKYKNYLSQNAMAGVTNLILCISAFTATLSNERIKKALESTTIYDIKKWTKEFVGKTLLQKRKEILCFE